ncbi:unknown protein [Parachlamydia acanthamoebae UV-7]|uniref:Uncharacterized protein n=1 Tax=Parachlamydia acanthamoebae (strain UV7) TaxID=765952 RepID=F8KZJ8_PARAV|nr:hypothetical protein [Parachlamydia acanthamoebae]CCB86338.1 unknown protein [Parachlamydia acanthamoebae UV-7]
MNKEKYKHITYDLTLNFGQLLARLNPEMTFVTLQAQGLTAGSKEGRIAWARVKKGHRKCLIAIV